ncbi:hypothetical protein Rs2_33959 [Raphanus sativus]|nr:hypothetical protein Rs2_33959 [Raphanus sativus]
MISQKIIVEFCVTTGNFTSFTLDLLPLIVRNNSLSVVGSFICRDNMADLLQKAIQAMSLEEEEPLTLPDSPRFRVIEENQLCLMGRLLNPDCQVMAKMIDFMPTAWRMIGRVRGIALSRDRFQFVFQREEDLLTVIKDGPWSYNYWAMVLERWSPNPPKDSLRMLDVWIRIRNIPAIFFKIETMYKLAAEVGKVEVVEYDPKASHTKEYIRALVHFDTDKPAKAARKLNVPEGGTVTIKFEYEKIHRRCFHCLRLTHERTKCPVLRKDSIMEKEATAVPSRQTGGQIITEPADGPPGFPVLFPELSKEERRRATLYVSHPDETERRARIERVNQSIDDCRMATSAEIPTRFPDLFPELPREERNQALLYISHADEKERRARIERVNKGIIESREAASLHLTRITKELDKGKGHVSYTALLEAQHFDTSDHLKDQVLTRNEKSDDDTESSAAQSVAHSIPLFTAGSGFQLGPSSEGRVLGNVGASKSQRRYSSSWKRRNTGNKESVGVPQLSLQITDQPPSSKRKAVAPINVSESKNKKLSDQSVASVLKPLLPQ